MKIAGDFFFNLKVKLKRKSSTNTTVKVSITFFFFFKKRTEVGIHKLEFVYLYHRNIVVGSGASEPSLFQ